MRILLIDASPLLFKVFTGPVKEFTTRTGEKTGLRFGVVRAVRAYEKKLNPDKVVLCWDMNTHAGSGPRFDNERGYKGNRDHTSEEAREIWDGIHDVQAMLALTKYTQAWADGFEADDVIGTLARQLAEQGSEVVIHSVDRDLWQLFSNPLIVGWENDKKKGQFFGPADVIGHFGVPPKHLLFYRAIEGDVSDNLKGIGVPPIVRADVKSWLNAIPMLFSLDGYEEEMKKVRPDLHAEVFAQPDRLKLLESNYRYMTLLTPDEISIVKGTNNVVALEGLFKSLEMKSLIPRVAEFARTTDDIL